MCRLQTSVSFYTTEKADFLTSKLAKCVILHNNRGIMFRSADFGHQCVILYNSKSRHFLHQNLPNAAFYTTAGAEVFDFLT